MVTPDLVIVDGHALWETMREIGAAEVYVAVLQNQTPAEIQELRLAIGRIPKDTRWNSSELRKEIGQLIEVSFDLELTGFDTAEIDSILRIDLPEANVVEDEDGIPPLTKSRISRFGDIFQLGRIALDVATPLIKRSSIASVMGVARISVSRIHHTI